MGVVDRETGDEVLEPWRMRRQEFGVQWQRSHTRVMRLTERGQVSAFGFFFQAEDGIRDIGVTGVQTCALPISFATGPYFMAHMWTRAFLLIAFPVVVGLVAMIGWVVAWWRGTLTAAGRAALAFGRSEERRVGKECRSRWSPYH